MGTVGQIATTVGRSTNHAVTVGEAPVHPPARTGWVGRTTGLTSGLASPMVELARIQHGAAPPLIPIRLSDATHVTGGWHLRPFESYLPGLDDHLILATFAGEGNATWRTAGQTLHAPVAAGAFTLVPRGHDGYWQVTGGGTYGGIFLGPTRLQRCANEVAGGRQPELMDRLQVAEPTMFRLMRWVAAEAESDGTDRALLLEQVLDLVCLHLLRAHSCSAARLEQVPRGGLAPWQVNRTIAYMRDHLDQAIALQDLADVARLSRFHFCSAFRLTTGSTPHEMLTRLRVDEACRLLTSSNQSISELALSVGFQSPSAFGARFRKAVGLTPTEFRRSRRFPNAPDGYEHPVAWTPIVSGCLEGP